MNTLMAVFYTILAIFVGLVIGECVYRLTIRFMPNPEPRFNEVTEDERDEIFEEAFEIALLRNEDALDELGKL